jgi:diacylglycerol kinase family enzyme
MPAVAFVVNGSLARAGGHFIASCTQAAARYGWQAEVLVTDKAESGVEAARGAALDGAGIVVAAGGDGTVRGCAEGLAGTGVPLGIVPHGTANLLARSLGIPSHPRAALDVALGVPLDVPLDVPFGPGGGRPGAPARSADRTIDLAVADGVPYTAMAGLGLDAAVVAGTRMKHHFGWFAYALSGALHLAVPPAPFSIRLDDGAPIERQARSVVVGNTGMLPGGFTLLPDARLDDGLLDVGVLAPRGPFGWTRVASRVLTLSQHQDRMLEWFQARKVEISTDARLPREVDGEVIASGHKLTVTVAPKALVVRVPVRVPVRVRVPDPDHA